MTHWGGPYPQLAKLLPAATTHEEVRAVMIMDHLKEAGTS